MSPISPGLILDRSKHALKRGVRRSSGDVFAKAPRLAFVSAVRTAQQMTTSSEDFVFALLQDSCPAAICFDNVPMRSMKIENTENFWFRSLTQARSDTVMRIIFLLIAIFLQLAGSSFDGEFSPKSDSSDLSPRQKYGKLNAIQKELLDQWRGLRRSLVRHEVDAQTGVVAIVKRIFERLEELPYPLSDKLVQLRSELESATTTEKLTEYMSALIDGIKDYKFFVAELVIAEDSAMEAF